MCCDLFYTSLTRLPSANEARMWTDFGDHGRGVRLIFRVQPILNHAELRWVRYQDPLLRTILQELMHAARTQLNLRLVLMGISRMGAFYLPMGYHEEDETRILIKRYNVPGMPYDPWAAVRNDGPHQFLPIPLNQDNGLCRIDLVRVDRGPKRRQRDVNRELRRNPLFAHLARPGCLGWFLPRFF